MKNYYYLMASVPSLDLRTAPAVSSEMFLNAASAQLPPEEFIRLRMILSDEPDLTGNGAAEEYLRWDRAVRNALVKLRAQGSEAVRDCREGDAIPSASALAALLYKTDSPLKAEQQWDAERWNYLENLKTGHYFDFDAVAVYALQLRLAERNASFREKEGEEQYSLLYKTVIGNESEIGV